MAVLDPATGDCIANVRTYSSAEIDAIIRAAETARKDWAGETAKFRANRLRAWFDLFIAHREQLAEICTRACGKPLAETRAAVNSAEESRDRNAGVTPGSSRMAPYRKKK